MLFSLPFFFVGVHLLHVRRVHVLNNLFMHAKLVTVRRKRRMRKKNSWKMFANNCQRSDITLIRIISTRRLLSIVAFKLYYFPYHFGFLFPVFVLSILFDSFDFPRRRVSIERWRNHRPTQQKSFRIYGKWNSGKWTQMNLRMKPDFLADWKWTHARAHHEQR